MEVQRLVEVLMKLGSATDAEVGELCLLGLVRPFEDDLRITARGQAALAALCPEWNKGDTGMAIILFGCSVKRLHLGCGNDVAGTHYPGSPLGPSFAATIGQWHALNCPARRSGSSTDDLADCTCNVAEAILRAATEDWSDL